MPKKKEPEINAYTARKVLGLVVECMCGSHVKVMVKKLRAGASGTAKCWHFPCGRTVEAGMDRLGFVYAITKG